MTARTFDAGTLAAWRAHAARCRRRMAAEDPRALLGRLAAALEEIERRTDSRDRRRTA